MESFDYKKYTWIAGMFALVGIFFASLALGASEWKSVKHPNGQSGTITVTGEGEITAKPDIATVDITVRESGATVPEAQKAVEAKVNAAVAALGKFGVSSKDQKTLSYTVNPKYETQTIYCITVPCPQGNQKIAGYEAAETVEITVHKIDQAGEIIGALGALNITEISGPSFTVEDMDAAQAQAKEKAIAQAREKAKATASSLGVELGEITQYNENGGGYPMYYKAMSVDASGASAPQVTLPQGDSVIKEQVTITYSLD
jgi:uncharacterized protein